ncbi:MAG: CoA-transferase [Leucobacter sp.]
MARRRGQPPVITAEEAAELVADGDTLLIEGSGGGIMEPDRLIAALGARYRETGAPRDLTLVNTTGIGDRAGAGLDHLAQPGLVRRAVAGNWGMAPEMSRMALAGEFEAYNFPQGVMAQMCREMAAGRPGVTTHVGLGTFCDPRIDGGRLNDRTTEDLVSVVQLHGREWLHYRSQEPTVAFIRATTADEDGNLSIEHEAARLEVLAIAQAVRNNGGTVIAQVERRAARGSLDPRTVVVPGYCVDAVVVVPDQRQLVEYAYEPALSGEIRGPLSEISVMPLTPRKVVGRRGLQEISFDDVVNLGVGIADGVAAVAAEEGCFDQFTLTVEQGLIGGVPVGGVSFGASYNPVAVIEQPAQFDFYDGGGLDIAFLGFAQFDRDGNINVSKFNGRLIGTGGFVDITQNTRTVCFCGTLTAGGLEVEIGDGRMTIRSEGRHAKAVREVEHITFNGKLAAERHQRVLLITERAVLRFEEDGWHLAEVAPGVDVQTEVLDLIPFPVRATEVRPMDEILFNDSPMEWKVE